jgi:hypothetical protein
MTDEQLAGMHRPLAEYHRNHHHCDENRTSKVPF